MNRTEKQQLVTELTDKIKGAKALYYTDFTGLNVKRMTDLRRRLRKAGVDYVVIGRTVTAAADPAVAMDEVLRELRGEAVGAA